MKRRIHACSVCRKPGHDRRAHARSDGLIVNVRALQLGPVTLTVELRGNIADLSLGDRALVFAIADMINAHDRAAPEGATTP